jgi:hypothetical protein
MLCFDIQATALHVDLNKWMKIWKECSDISIPCLGIARDGISFGIWNLELIPSTKDRKEFP